MLELAKRTEELKEKGVTVVWVKASNIERQVLNEWVEKNKIPSPIGTVEGDAERTRLNWGVKSLPWLILTDASHIVTAEGFDLNELAEKIKSAQSDSVPPTPEEVKEQNPGDLTAAQTRVVQFPKDRPVGALYAIDVGFPAERPFPEAEPKDWLFGYLGGFGVDNCRSLGPAMGEVRVPADKMIRLDLYPGAWKGGQVLAGLKPDDIQILSLTDAD
ncbi:MAG: hypothetical protein ACYTBJ_18590, partial [Planctomycetota bacterium]